MGCLLVSSLRGRPFLSLLLSWWCHVRAEQPSVSRHGEEARVNMLLS